MLELTKELMNSVTEACARSLFIRSLLENQSFIETTNKLKIDELKDIIDKIMIIETEKYQVLLYILSSGSTSIQQLVSELKLSEFSVMKHVLALQNEGWLELRDKNNLIYGIKSLITKSGDKLELDLISPSNLRSIYDPIKIVVDAQLCCLCGICKAICPVDAISIKEDMAIIS